MTDFKRRRSTKKHNKNEGNLSSDQILISIEVIKAPSLYLLEPIDCNINNGGCEEECIRGANSNGR